MGVTQGAFRSLRSCAPISGRTVARLASLALAASRSSASFTRSSASGKRWPYRSSTVTTEVCPARTAISRGVAPAAIQSATAVWRRSWGRSGASPAASTSWLPEASTPAREPNGTSFGSGEDQVGSGRWIRPRGVCQAHRSRTRSSGTERRPACLWWAVVEMSGHLRTRFQPRSPRPCSKFEVLDYVFRPSIFADAGGRHRRREPQARGYRVIQPGVREFSYLGWREEPGLLAFDAGQANAGAGRSGNPTGRDGGRHDLS